MIFNPGGKQVVKREPHEVAMDPSTRAARVGTWCPAFAAWDIGISFGSRVPVRPRSRPGPRAQSLHQPPLGTAGPQTGSKPLWIPLEEDSSGDSVGGQCDARFQKDH